MALDLIFWTIFYSKDLSLYTKQVGNIIKIINIIRLICIWKTNDVVKSGSWRCCRLILCRYMWDVGISDEIIMKNFLSTNWRAWLQFFERCAQRMYICYLPALRLAAQRGPLSRQWSSNQRFNATKLRTILADCFFHSLIIFEASSLTLLHIYIFTHTTTTTNRCVFWN